LKTMGIKCFLIEPILDKNVILFHSEDDWPPFYAHIGWRNPLTGEEKRFTHDFGVGAMWWATWYPKNIVWGNETEPHLMVATPGGDWDIDSRASNCTQPDDTLHRCWVRHGVPPLLDVDKHGVTCNAGAGSIQCGSFHGFLRAGEFI
jgi:hypothetical protein